MKPQCETAADCLEQLARVMRGFGFASMIDAIRSEFIHYEGEQYNHADKYHIPHFDNPTAWSFAIAKLEDKPVFLGDTCYFNGVPIVISGIAETLATGVFLTLQTDHEKLVWNVCINELSWTPSKQTVTLKVGDNEPIEVEKAFTYTYKNIPDNCITMYHHETYEAAEQFRKAMKPLVKENDK